MIEKKTFVTTTATDRQTEVYNWLTANATEYFETITNDTENKKIICTFAGCESAKLEVNFNTGNSVENATFKVVLENSKSYSAGNYQLEYKVLYAIKTSCGICLSNSLSMMTSNKSEDTSLSLSKNNDNTTAISLIKIGELNTGNKYRYIICPEKSKVITVTSKVLTADMTTFAPIPIAEGVYPENMFFTPFSSARYSGVITDDNGQKYWYDGYCAIKE